MAGLRQIIDDGSLPLRMDEHPRKRLNILQARVEIPNLDMLTRIEAGGPGSGRKPEGGSYVPTEAVRYAVRNRVSQLDDKPAEDLMNKQVHEVIGDKNHQRLSNTLQKHLGTLDDDEAEQFMNSSIADIHHSRATRL